MKHKPAQVWYSKQFRDAGTRVQTIGRRQTVERFSSMAESGARGRFHRGTAVRILQFLCVGLGELESDEQATETSKKDTPLFMAK